MDRGSPGSAFGTECSCRSAGSIAARDVPSQSPRVANAPTLQVATRLRSFLRKYLKKKTRELGKLSQPRTVKSRSEERDFSVSFSIKLTSWKPAWRPRGIWGAPKGDLGDKIVGPGQPVTFFLGVEVQEGGVSSADRGPCPDAGGSLRSVHDDGGRHRLGEPLSSRAANPRAEGRRANPRVTHARCGVVHDVVAERRARRTDVAA